MVLSDLFLLLLFNDTMFAHICGVLPFAATWMELEDVILSEMSQAQKRQVPHDLVHI
jgi:translation initiation factor IF-1